MTTITETKRYVVKCIVRGAENQWTYEAESREEAWQNFSDEMYALNWQYPERNDFSIYLASWIL